MKNLCVAFRDMPLDGAEVVESGLFDREHLPEIPRHGSITRATLDAWLAESRKGVKK
jgi:hypothetical protein